MRTVKFAALFSVAALLSPLSLAANSEPLEETVVTATRTPEPVNSLAASVIVITREDIERSLALDIGSLLAQHAGLEVARNGGPGQAASLFVRGTNSDHTLVMIDGVRINPGTIGGAAIHNIAPDTVERVEIVKGPRSTLWGSDAIGGVVNIFTRAASAQGIGLSLAGGRYGNRSVQLDGGMRLAERGSVGFAFGQVDSDGFPPLLTSNEDRGFQNRSVNLSGQYRATDLVTLNAHAWRAQGTSDYLDFFAAPVSQDFRNQALGVDADIRTNGRGRYRLALLQMDDDIRQVDVEDFVSTRRTSVDLQGNWQLTKNLELTAGTVLSREDTESLSFGSGFNERSNIKQAYAQAQYQHGAQRVGLAVGALDHPAFGNHPTWNADYALRLGRGFTITAAAGTAFKAPDATDRFGLGANPSVRP
jgi:vitamin B12 transporter